MGGGDEARIELADWIDELRAELQRAQRQGADESVEFTVGPVELEFEVTATREREGRGGVRFWVVDAGGSGKRGSGQTQRVKLTLTPRVRGTAPGGDATLAVGEDRLTHKLN